ncbi:hypothetical protein CASFOL_024380 [Castilleja foliolosa]|uniref:Homeobox domain-containing protein n=1 Tax=Castilleja foliolosa TaxID=1961234 RepID=A0ABD3CPY7_9LAMI
MWMMDFNDNYNHGNESKVSSAHDDPMFGRKLRPLMPRPTAAKSIPFSSISSPSCFCTHQNPNILPLWNHHHPIGGLSEYGVRREIQTVPLVSTRWNPTPEQLQALEELYRRGTRTPSAEQIQQIAARLRRFGKIEGKNVFYWFQNHKARERQKKRRQLELLAGKKTPHNNNNVHHTLETNHQTGLSKRYFEIEHQDKKLATLLNCTTSREDSASMHGSVIAERKKDVWTQFHQKELQTAKNEITSWKLDISSSHFHTSSAGQENTKPSNRVMNENRTLQLFPIGSLEDEIIIHDHVDLGNKIRPNEFIEFLPTKK